MNGVWYEKRRYKWRVMLKGRFIGRFVNKDKAIEKCLDLEKRFPKITSLQLKCYLLCSPDFKGLTQRQAAQLLQCSYSNIFRALKGLKKKFPQLFPLYKKYPQIHCFDEYMTVRNPKYPNRLWGLKEKF